MKLHNYSLQCSLRQPDFYLDTHVGEMLRTEYNHPSAHGGCGGERERDSLSAPSTEVFFFLKGRMIYFGSQFEGIGHHDQEGMAEFVAP